ncbi:HpcH/HpaI aldolase family protein [Megasphaera vaginalis (ex Bordigoni et al. 2020)]|uniref:HpcH/HpaI aldolase family protein n=1 Tax=Megasphaera vaginalis (ex Bordigoni et al. 2020) TaxID=2045301 RepID=UPI000C7B5959|nr:aldolase/citrate lyase family protein [Megasphaera vaginalis (ex Bordigoni et al. 2020)]
MHNRLKEKLQNREKAIGTFFESGSTITAECLALGGLDYIIIDTEHGPFETESAMEFICACQRRKMTPLVRVKDKYRSSILKMLDVGAMGIVIPGIESVAEVNDIVRYGKYYPVGERGVAYARGCGYGFADSLSITDYFAEANRETLLLPQCETAGCLDRIEEIAAIEGIDGIFIGPYDLSTALGKPGQFTAPEVISAIDRILKACQQAGKFSMIYADDTAAAKRRFQQGFDSVAVNMDTILFIRMIQNLVRDLRH